MKRAVLEKITGDKPFESVKLRRDATIIGREKGDIRVPDKEVSASHCQIQCIGDTYHLFDMNSSNGTFLNHERILRAKLVDQDVIEIGLTKFRFHLKEESELRNVVTVFSQNGQHKNLPKASMVDTIIESEIHSSKMWKILIQIRYGNGEKESIELQQREVFMGRASSFGRFDEDAQLSRKHLKIVINDQGELFVEDQRSTNGSWINDKRISGLQPVLESDTIRIGSCELNISSKRRRR